MAFKEICWLAGWLAGWHSAKSTGNQGLSTTDKQNSKISNKLHLNDMQNKSL